MDVKVASKLGQAVARAVSPSTLIGDGMLVRLRSTTIGILGLVAAVGLGLVGFVSHQGWPGVFGGPLPQAPSRLVENDSIAAPPPVAPRRTAQGGRHRPGRSSAHGSPGSGPTRSTAPVDTDVSARNPIGASPPVSPGGNGGHTGASVTSPPPTVVAEAPPGEDHPTKGPSKSQPAQPTTSSPGHSGEAPGHSDEAPGHSGDAPGRSRDAPGHSSTAPGRSSEAPGHSGEAHGHSAEAPGRSGKSHGARH